MFTVLRGFIYLWQNKGLFLFVALGLPVFYAIYLLAQPQPYTAHLALRLTPQANLIQQLHAPLNLAELNIILKSNALLADTTQTTGTPLQPEKLYLHHPTPEILTLTYYTQNPTNIPQTLETHAQNFIGALIAPTRLRLTGQLEQASSPVERTQLQQTLQSLSAPTLQPGYPALVEIAQPTTLIPPPSKAKLIALTLPFLTLTGVILGLAVVLLKRLTAAGLYSNVQITQRANLKVLGRLPNFGPLLWRQGQWHRTKLPAVLPMNYTETTRIQQALMGGQSGSLAIVATQAGEGTSLIAYILANRAAADGKRVLLIDTNLKNHSLTTWADQKPQTWAVAEQKNLGDVADLAIQTTPNLYVLPAPADQASIKWLGETTNLTYLFTALKQKFDWVILDTSPLTAKNRHNIDPTLLASVADHTAVILLTGETSRIKFTLAMRDLANTTANIAGIIVNDHHNPSVKEIIQNLATTVRPLLPGLATWLSHRVR